MTLNTKKAEKLLSTCTRHVEPDGEYCEWKDANGRVVAEGFNGRQNRDIYFPFVFLFGFTTRNICITGPDASLLFFVGKGVER